MKDMVNGTDLGPIYNWDNDLCRKIVDQKYRVNAKKERSTSEKTEFSSPLMCLIFVNTGEKEGFTVNIEERKYTAADQPYWQPIAKNELERILQGEREPAYRLKVLYNPHFDAYIGD